MTFIAMYRDKDATEVISTHKTEKAAWKVLRKFLSDMCEWDEFSDEPEPSDDQMWVEACNDESEGYEEGYVVEK